MNGEARLAAGGWWLSLIQQPGQERAGTVAFTIAAIPPLYLWERGRKGVRVVAGRACFLLGSHPRTPDARLIAVRAWLGILRNSRIARWRCGRRTTSHIMGEHSGIAPTVEAHADKANTKRDAASIDE